MRQRAQLLWGGLVAALVIAIVAIWFLWDTDPQPVGNSSKDSGVEESAAPRAPSQTPSPTKESAPTLPAEAKANTSEGAAAFGRYFFGLQNYVQRSGDVEALKPVLYLEKCGQCRTLVKRFEESNSNGWHVVGGTYEVLTVRAEPFDRSQMVTLTLNREAAHSEDGNGREIPNSAAQAKTNYTGMLQVFFKDGQWKIVKFINPNQR